MHIVLLYVKSMILYCHLVAVWNCVFKNILWIISSLYILLYFTLLRKKTLYLNICSIFLHPACRSSCCWMMDRMHWWRRCWTPTCSSFRSTNQLPLYGMSLLRWGSLYKRYRICMYITSDTHTHSLVHKQQIISKFLLCVVSSFSLSLVPQCILPG